MKLELYWNILIRSRNKDTVNKVLSNIESEIGDLIILNKEIYWKDESLFNVEFEQNLNSSNLEGSILEVLKKCSHFSSDWAINLPDCGDFGVYQLSGISDKPFRINGVYWVNMEFQATELDIDV